MQTLEGFTIPVQDECIFVHEVIVRRKLWLPRGIRLVVITSGSHQNTCVFGTLTLEGKKFFRQYEMFDQDTFLAYLEEIKKKLGKVILFLDRAPQHRSKKVREYLENNMDMLRIVYVPKRSPQFNAVGS